MPNPSAVSTDELSVLVGARVVSDLSEAIEYQLGNPVGAGAMAVAFFAMRHAPEGQCPVVLKVLRPALVREFNATAALAWKKELIALGRLNERVPSTPFVVRLLDTGSLVFQEERGALRLPWIALEYVHDSAEGTTLTQRVTKSVQDTGAAFNLQRAARAVDCLIQGLSAVHEVGVIHRDIKPGNVLCCGQGPDELFKVADFGVARPEGVTGTFLTEIIGTPGYVAPEAFGGKQAAIGPWTDVFSLAGVIYFLLTGQKYLPINHFKDMLQVMGSPQRKSVLDSPLLSPELRQREPACRAIDRALAAATALPTKDRPQSVEAFGALLLPWLQPEPRSARNLVPSLSFSLPEHSSRSRAGWNWIVRHHPADQLTVHTVGWDSDGRCLATTSAGLRFWNGTRWQPVPFDLPDSPAPRFVHRVGPSRWIVGYQAASLATFAMQGVLDTLDLSDRLYSIELFSGQLGDLAVMVERRSDGRLALHALCGWRWIRPIILDGVKSVSSLSRIGDARWLLAGVHQQDGGMVAVYDPLDFHLHLIRTPPVRAFVSCTGRDALEVGAAGGTSGAIVWCHRTRVLQESVEGRLDVSALALDPTGDGWAAGVGRIWHRQAPQGQPANWNSLWHESRWQVPFVSLYADTGLVIGVTADGALVEGTGPDTEPDTERVKL